MLSQLPPELVHLLALDHLDHRSILRLSHTSSILRSLLTNSQAIWAKAVFDKTGIKYIEEGGDWRKAYFDQGFCAMCPHLSSLASDAVINHHATRFHNFLDAKQIHQIECFQDGCSVTTPSVWMCLEQNCGFVGCSRVANGHGAQHFQMTQHSLTMKIDSLEFWCYGCSTWLGAGPAVLPAQSQLCDKIMKAFVAPDREPFISLRSNADWNYQRNLERETMELKPGDKLFFVEQGFMQRWRDFINSKSKYPGVVDNSSLLMGEESENDQGASTQPTKKRFMKPDLRPFQDFMIVNEESWNMLMLYNGGGPMVCASEHIPDGDPRYVGLWKGIEAYKKQFLNLTQRDDGSETSDSETESHGFTSTIETDCVGSPVVGGYIG